LNSGAEVSRDNLQPGDLVFFHSTYATSSPASHCGIYVGNGQFVHSASGGNRGITVSNLSDSYYSRHYLTARRIPM
jgi:cell wall-associated NlpC family hydrolase